MYIDLLRGWAVIVMVEVHVVNGFLLPGMRAEGWFEVLNFINGLVAPSFLFISGYSFTLIAQRKWHDYLSLNSVFSRQIMRILQVLIVGYALHFPVFSFAKAVHLDSSGWNVFWNVDVLHTIASSLFVLLMLVLVMRNPRRFFYAVVVLALTMIFTSPLVYDTNVDAFLPLPLANYVSAYHHSQFPLFPWMGFVLCGSIVSQAVVWSREQRSERSVFRTLLSAGFLVLVFSTVSVLTSFSLYPVENYWRSSPAFFFIRLGIVVMLLSLLWFWEQRFRSKQSLVSIVGSESLVAYAGHLLVIYGMFFNNHSLSFLIGRTRTAEEAAVMSLMLIAFTIAVSYCWHRIKNWSMFYARVLQYSILVVVLYIFFTKPL